MLMSAIVIVGAQWGDEGKGKIVDLLTETADVVVRYAGGPNAGHTLVVGEERIIVRLIPSGILRPRARCVMGQGMVVDPGVLLGEIDTLEVRGHDTSGRLFVSDRAHLILPYHPEIDVLREHTAGASTKIGTTKRGIGPCYEDKVARRGIRAGDLRDLALVQAKVERAIAAWAPGIEALGGKASDPRRIVEDLRPIAERLCPLVTDTSVLLDEALKKGQRV